MENIFCILRVNMVMQINVSMPGKNCSRRHLKYFAYFDQKMCFDISCRIVS